MSKWWISIASVIFVLLFACGKSHVGTHLKIAATSTPQAEILEYIKPKLLKDGVDLDIIIVDDYNIPNRALADKEVDANFFQHEPFLKLQMKEFGYPLEEFAKVEIEPMGLYSLKIHHLEDLKEGAKVAIPQDPTNQARALMLLEKAGLLKLKKDSIDATVFDVLSNPKKLDLIEVDASLIPRSLNDVNLAAINTNFALQAGLNPKSDALLLEGESSLFVNILVIRKGDEGREDLQLLKKELQSPDVKEFIKEYYYGAVIPAF